LVIFACVALYRIVRRYQLPSAKSPSAGSDSEWIEPEEIAERLGVPVDWVWTMAAREEIPVTRTSHGIRGFLSGNYRFRRADIETWLASRMMSNEQGRGEE
jgi:excisionase family DNA binding protein